MLQSKILNVVGLLAPVVISPVVAFLPLITLGTVFRVEHSSGSLLVSAGMVAFLLLARLKGDDIRTVLAGSALFLAAISAFVLRGGILHGLATSANPAPAPALTGIKVAVIIIVYLLLAAWYLRYILVEPRPQAPQTARIIGWAEDN